jgi:hypothetical protein
MKILLCNFGHILFSLETFEKCYQLKIRLITLLLLWFTLFYFFFHKFPKQLNLITHL